LTSRLQLIDGRKWQEQLMLRKHCILVLVLALVQFASTHALGGEASVSLDIAGLKGEQLRNVEAALAMPPGIVRDNEVEEHWLEHFVNRMPELVADALEPFGFYRSATSASIEKTDELTYRVMVKIDPGPQTKVRTLNIRITGEGDQNKQLLSIIREFPLRVGDSLDHRLYEQGKLDLRLEANNLGFLEGHYTTRVIRVDPGQNAADIELAFATGPQFYFGKTSFNDASDSYPEDFLRRFLTYREGEVFSHRQLHRSRLKFYAADRFDNVLMVPLMDEKVGRKIPIRVDLVSGKRHRLRPGIGYGTDTGARVSLSYKNLKSGEHPHARLADLSLAEKTQFFESSYTIPRPGSSDDNLIGTVGVRDEDLDSYETRMYYVEVERSYGLARGKIGSLFLRYLYEDGDVANEDDKIAKLVIPGVRYYQRDYDDPLNPTSGYQFRAELRGSHDALLSNLTIGQVIAAGSFMLPLTSNLTLHPRVEAATSIKDDEFSDVPPSMRFFVGGNNSVRGYAFKSRGPENKYGDVIGGDSLLVGSLELEYALNEQWGLALFYDAGSAFDAGEDMDVYEGAGIGVRRYTQIGPIKLDIATRVNDDNEKIRLHFSVGFDI
jgi:translocation and assembly module TamA